VLFAKCFRGLAAARMIACAFVMTASLGTVASAHTQCAPYAREISGIDLHGAAGGWWGQAEGLYARGHDPKIGSVLAFRATHAMPSGHVAVVKSVVDSRHILLDHANWSHPGAIEHSALAEDVSPEGDWSQVRVWYAPINGLGTRSVPAYGFIYNKHGRESTTLARADAARPGFTDLADAPHVASVDHVNIPGF